ncbi:glycoside hydrolase family 45 protein, partial [Aureobasidium melanogenum]
MSSIKFIALLALATGFASVASAAQTGKTTRYWDCCKGSCAWPGKADVSAPITTCDKNDNPLTDANTASSCDGGSAYMCSDQSPWAVSDNLAYGFAAANIAGGSEESWCCSCYKLTFTTTSIAGKTMIVQATNTGGDLGSNQFDLAIPGGGVGIFNACTDEWNAPASGWGAQYGGISTNTCSAFPKALQPGCGFRFDWFENADNPEMEFERVECPAAITAKSGCKRTDDGSQAYPSIVSAAAASSSSSPAAASSSSSAAQKVAATSASSEAAVSSASTASAVESSAAAYSSAAIVESSAAAYTSAAAVESSSSSAAVTEASSTALSSAAAPASSAASSDDANCNVQYVYEYDL